VYAAAASARRPAPPPGMDVLGAMGWDAAAETVRQGPQLSVGAVFSRSASYLYVSSAAIALLSAYCTVSSRFRREVT